MDEATAFGNRGVRTDACTQDHGSNPAKGGNEPASGARPIVHRVRKGGGEGFIDLPKLVPPTALQKKIEDGIAPEEIAEALARFEGLKTSEKLDLLSAAKRSGRAELAVPLARARPHLLGFRGKWDPVLGLRYLRACSSLLTAPAWAALEPTVAEEERRPLAVAFLEALGDLVERSSAQLDESQWFAVFESYRGVAAELSGLVPADPLERLGTRVRTSMVGCVEEALSSPSVLARGRIWPLRFLALVATGEDGALFLRVARGRSTMVAAWGIARSQEEWSRGVLQACVEAGARWGDAPTRVGLAGEVVEEIRKQQDPLVRQRLLQSVVPLLASDCRSEVAGLLRALPLTESESRMVDRLELGNPQGRGR